MIRLAGGDLYAWMALGRTRDTVLTCYGGAGFDPTLNSQGGQVLTVGLDDLYSP